MGFASLDGPFSPVSCMPIRIPGGGNGTLLKLWIPCRYVLADMLGLMWVGRIMLRIFSHCGINLHHRCRGNLGLIPTRPAMRWDLPVWMDRSAQFILCICGRVS